MNISSLDNNEDIKKTLPSTSEDGIYIDGKIPKSFSSLGTFFANHSGDDKNLYATTWFHGLYNGENLVDNDGNKQEFGECFDKWKEECEYQNSATYSTSYCFRSKAYKERTDETSYKGSSLGTFFAAIYDESHDLYIVKVDEGVALNWTIPETVEHGDLTQKSYIGQKIADNRRQQKSFSISKTGFKTGLTTGTLDDISFCILPR